MQTLRPLLLFFRHGITQAASLIVYHYSGPYISYATRLIYEQYYEWAYGIPEWWSLENIIYYLPQREYWTHQGFQYGEFYGPIICATLAAWCVHHAQKKLYGSFSHRPPSQEETLHVLRELSHEPSVENDPALMQQLNAIIQAVEAPVLANTPQYQAFVARRPQTSPEALQALPVNNSGHIHFSMN